MIATQSALISESFTELKLPMPDQTGLKGEGWVLNLKHGYHLKRQTDLNRLTLYVKSLSSN